ncbi:Receptor-type guanylate cyclase gcy-12 [Bulinus truncatus]|nr:Receptor-type guanylate cyclase gcy-12 [Bulinus truncatus]
MGYSQDLFLTSLLSVFTLNLPTCVCTHRSHVNSGQHYTATGMSGSALVTNKDILIMYSTSPSIRNSTHPNNTLSNATEFNPLFVRLVPPRNESLLTLGYLVDKTLTPRNHFWKSISGALLYAIDDVNNQRIVPGYNLTYVFRNTRGETNQTLYEMSHLWRDGVVGFIGPDMCTVEGQLVAAWNLPMISHDVQWAQIFKSIFPFRERKTTLLLTGPTEGSPMDAGLSETAAWLTHPQERLKYVEQVRIQCYVSCCQIRPIPEIKVID